MRDLILDALKAASEAHPNLRGYLKGTAAWYAGALALKAGEAPDDEQRLRDERNLAKKLEQFFEGQLDRILRELKRQYKTLSFEFWSEEERALWEMFSDDFVGILMHGVNGGISGLGDIANLINVDNLTSLIIAYGRTYRADWLKLISETTRDFVEKSTLEWVASGDPLSELIKTLSNPELGVFSKTRAARIATTEVTRLYSLGNKLAWEQSGTVKEFIWQTANDEAVCPICGSRHNQVYPLEQMKEIPAHPNCRCWAKPVVNYEGFANEIDRILAGR